MTEIEFLGTRGATSSEDDKHKHNSSIILRTEKHSILVDWGESFKNRDLPDVDYILLTHSHEDHAGGLKGRTIKIPVYCSSITLRDLGDEYDFDKVKTFDATKSETVKITEEGELEITTIPVIHS